MKFSNKLLFLSPVIAGALLLFVMVTNRQEPSRPELSEQAKTVSIINARPMMIIPRVKGYGYVRPSTTWQALPEVSGRVIEMHPELKKGAFMKKGELLVRIDPESYGLAESRSAASVMSVDAQLKELAQQKINTEKLLELEQQKLRLATQELERSRQLYEKGVISVSDFDQEQRSLLAQQSAVDNLVNTLRLIPSQEKALLARKESDETSLVERRLDIEKTVIRTPFACRIAEVNIQLNEFAQIGKVVLEAIDISKVEIPVQLSPTAFSNLISPKLQRLSPLEDAQFDMEVLRKLVGISAIVRVPLSSKEAEWEGVFKRTSESIDLESGTITAYIQVDSPYQKVIPSKRPPLVPNLYAEVEMRGIPRENRYVIPLQSVHDGSIHVVDKNMRLKTIKVEIEMVMGNMAIVSEGLPDEIMVITTDLVPAIEGMLLKPVINQELTDKIAAFEAGR
jgi:hypothetical protein